MRLKWLRNYSNNDLPQEISIAKGWHWNAVFVVVAAAADDDTVVAVVATSVIFTRWTLISGIRIGVKTILCSLVVYFNFYLWFDFCSFLVLCLHSIANLRANAAICSLSIDNFFPLRILNWNSFRCKSNCNNIEISALLEAIKFQYQHSAQ